ncbi:amidohydrolase family protein [Bacillus sp. 03113]|uniref:amidohydrolase family protein n=1 Tax=Bacillus sp. 03113 TaxID=2578211 RepID=UPI0011437415|nr:amidohydrolase family protein [Bacillus sp. 03113]
MKDDLLHIPLIDHHCHAIVDEGRKGDVEALIRVTSEAPSSYSLFDLKQRPIWHAVKTIVRRYTGGEFINDDELAYVLRQQDYKAYCRSLFNDSRYQALYIDTGYSPASALTLEKLADLTDIDIYPILRIESLAENEFESRKTFSEWWESVLYQIKAARESGYIGAKSIAAYRSGLSLYRVSSEAAKESFERWKKSGANRLTEGDVLNFLVWNAAPVLAEQSLPLQFHTGYGDPDTDLRLGNPLLLRDFIETFTPNGLSVVLLHCYPYHREAGYLSSVYDNVFFDTSLILPLGLSSARRVVAEALELAPYSRYLFASDAHTRPEMFALAAELFRDAFAFHLEDPLMKHYTSGETRENWAKHVFQLNSKKLYFGIDN